MQNAPSGRRRQTLRQEVADLRNQLAGMRVVGSSNRAPARNNSRARRRRSRSRSRNRGIPGAYTTGPRSASTNASFNMGMGRVVLEARELVATVTVAAGKNAAYALVGITASDMETCHTAPRLIMMAAMFEQYRFMSAQIEWEPMVGTTQAGAISLAVLPSDARTAVTAVPDAATMAACQPNSTGRVYTPVKLSVPTSYLKSRPWFRMLEKDTKLPADIPAVGAVLVEAAAPNTGGLVTGRIWLTYKAELQGFTTNS